MITGGDGNDGLSGGGGADTLIGGNGVDALNGDAGDDILIGGAGNDVMNGMAGNDTFRFAAGFGNDTISGFDANPGGGQDVLNVADLGINAGNFNARVAIVDLGANMLVTIDGTETIMLLGVNGMGANAITDGRLPFRLMEDGLSSGCRGHKAAAARSSANQPLFIVGSRSSEN